jgi:hypothetical protein
MAANRGLYNSTGGRALYSTDTNRMLFNPTPLTFTMGTYKNIQSTNVGSTTRDTTSPYVFTASELVTAVGDFKTAVKDISVISPTTYMWSGLYARMILFAANSGYTDASAGYGVGTIHLCCGAAKLTRTDSTGIAARRVELTVSFSAAEGSSFGGKSQVDMVSNTQTTAYELFRAGGSFEVVSLASEPSTEGDIIDAADVIASIDVDTINTNADLAGLSIWQEGYWGSYGNFGTMQLQGTYNGHVLKLPITDATFLDDWEEDEARWIGVRFKAADIPTATSYQSAVPASRTAAEAGALTKDVASLFFQSTITAYGY